VCTPSAVYRKQIRCNPFFKSSITPVLQGYKIYGSQTTNTVYNVERILVIAFEFTGAVHSFVINFMCGSQGQKG